MEKEEWRDIPGCPNYQASNLGRIRSITKLIPIRRLNYKKFNQRRRGKILSPSRHPNGYQFLFIGKHISVHRAVALAFLPNPKKLREVNHKNFVRDDNRVTNLEWTSSAENKRHAINMGRMRNSIAQPGEKHYMAKLTEPQVLEIRDLYKTGHFTHLKLAQKYNVARETIGLIVRRKNWKHI